MDFILVIILCVVPILLLNYFSLGAQKEFIRLYRQKIDPNQLFYPDEVVTRYSRDPNSFANDAPKMMLIRLQIFWRNYNDKKLNNAARKVKMYFIAMAIVIVLNFIFFSKFV